jgi:hypothetical protein
MTDRGDVLAELRRSGLLREGEQQGLVLGPLVRGSDEHLYFAAVGDDGSWNDRRRAPHWGSQLWRLRLPERCWERIAHLPGVVALAAYDQQLALLAEPGPVLARFDLQKGIHTAEQLAETSWRFEPGLWLDHRGHLFLRRAAAAASGDGSGPLSLVELNSPLRELLVRDIN